MIKFVLFLFCFASALTLSVSESKSASVQPHAAESFSVGYIQVLKYVFFDKLNYFFFSFGVVSCII